MAVHSQVLQLYLNLDCCDLHLATSNVYDSARHKHGSGDKVCTIRTCGAALLLMQRSDVPYTNRSGWREGRTRARNPEVSFADSFRYPQGFKLDGRTSLPEPPYIHIDVWPVEHAVGTAVDGKVRIVDLSANLKPICHQAKDNIRVSISLRLSGIVFLYLLRCSLSTTKSNPTHSYFH